MNETTEFVFTNEDVKALLSDRSKAIYESLGNHLKENYGDCTMDVIPAMSVFLIDAVSKVSEDMGVQFDEDSVAAILHLVITSLAVNRGCSILDIITCVSRNVVCAEDRDSLN